jgi:hypothetical protein
MVIDFGGDRSRPGADRGLWPKGSTHGCRFAAGNSRNSQGCSEGNVQFMTVMATKMPYIGHG